MATRLLIIHRQLVFAVTIKQALEQTGLFDVHPFTTPEAAFDYLRDHPQDVALVDFALPGKPGATVVQDLRAIQSDIAVIASPNHPDAELLQVHGTIDVPFTARELVPVIQQAIEAASEPPPARHAPDQPPAPPESHPGTTRLLGDSPSPDAPYGLSEETPTPVETPRSSGQQPPSGKTRIFDEPPPIAPVGQTRRFDDDEPLPDQPSQTRRLDDDQPELPPTRQPVRTRALSEPEPPPDVPEFSTLDSVLKSFDFEPLATEEDTPSVPERDSDAVRQYLATTPDAEPNAFDEILGAIEAEPPDSQSRPPRRTDFDNLVESMRGSEPHKPLPERQQRSLDFILTSGMDAVLQEIEKAKTGPLKEPRPEAKPPQPKPPAATFQKLAQEEPPMPTLEESGTVTDLMTGIGDRGFRNVLAMLRGEDVEDVQRSPAAAAGEDDDFAAFNRPDTLPEEPAARPPVRQASEPATGWWDFEELSGDDSGEESVAHVVLQTAFDDDLPDSLPLADVMNEIESRLAAHKLHIRPLPSWGMDTGAFRALNESGVIEPDFLPEELPPGEVIEPPLDVPELPPSDASSRTTQPSPSLQFEPPPPEMDTAVDQAFAQETMPSRATQPPAPLDDLDQLFSGLDEAPLADEAALDDFEELLTEEEVPSPDEVDTYFEEVDTTPPATTTALQPDWLPEEAAEAYAEPAPAPDLSAVFASMEAEFESDWSLEDETPPEDFEAAEPEPLSVEEEEHSGWTPPQGTPAVPDTAYADYADEDRVEAGAALAEAPDPVVAQLALNLTQASLELTAEGTILTRGSEIIAAAGHLNADDVNELLQVIADDWETNPEGARFRFVSLPSSGKDYMLYSIQTTGGLTLSMIFAGTTPLRVIRKQAQKLVQALEAVPEAPAAAPPVEAEPSEPAAAPAGLPPPAAVTNAYACVWLLHDPEQHLAETVAQAIIAGLKIQLQEQGWVVHLLQVHEDFVYLLADVPGERPPHEIIRELKRRSGDIAHSQNPDLTPQMLWADSYLVLTPGRELQTEEILEFINFQRML